MSTTRIAITIKVQLKQLIKQDKMLTLIRSYGNEYFPQIYNGSSKKDNLLLNKPTFGYVLIIL